MPPYQTRSPYGHIYASAPPLHTVLCILPPNTTPGAFPPSTTSGTFHPTQHPTHFQHNRNCITTSPLQGLGHISFAQSFFQDDIWNSWQNVLRGCCLGCIFIFYYYYYLFLFIFILLITSMCGQSSSLKDKSDVLDVKKLSCHISKTTTLFSKLSHQLDVQLGLVQNWQCWQYGLCCECWM